MSRIIWSVARFTSGLPQCAALALAGMLLANLYLLQAPVSVRPDATALFLSMALVLLLPLVSSAFVARKPFAERTMIVGTSQFAHTLFAEIAARPDCSYVVVAVIADVADSLDYPFHDLLVGPLSELGTIINELRPDRIVVALADRRGRLPVRDLLEARVRGVVVEDGVELYERLTGKIAIESLTPSALIASPDFRKSHFDLTFGHALSLIVSAVGLVVFAPLFAVIALAIKLDSRGPVFFVQERAGTGGRRFKLLKFRTMRPVEHAASEWARDNSDRITRVGAWLRKYRLDELPQLISILRGEMNLVGPRPHPISNLGLFTEKIPYYSLRCVVRPGLTGWAQVCQGYASSLEEETEKMRYDLYYIKHMSAWLDLRILVRTIRTVLYGQETKADGRKPTSTQLSLGRFRALWTDGLQFVSGASPIWALRAPVLASKRREFWRTDRLGALVKEKAMKSASARSTVALLVLGFALAMTPALGAQTLQDLQVVGSGTVETNCAPTLATGCTVATGGTVTATAGGMAILTGTFAIRVDLGGPAAQNGWPGGPFLGWSGPLQGICLPATYLGDLTAANGDVLTFSNVGTICEEAVPGSSFQFNGTFRITSGSGQFAAAAGAGSVAISYARTDLKTFVKMSGVITY